MAMRAQQAHGTAYRELGRCDAPKAPAYKARQDTAVMWTRLASFGLWRVAAGRVLGEPTVVMIGYRMAMAMRAQQAHSTAYRELGRCDVPKGPAYKARQDTAVM